MMAAQGTDLYDDEYFGFLRIAHFDLVWERGANAGVGTGAGVIYQSQTGSDT